MPAFLLPDQRRFGFSIAKDISLLKSCIQHNPWQCGEKNWKTILMEMKLCYAAPTMTIRTLKNRVRLLVRQMQAQELVSKTAAQHEQTERITLLEAISGILEAESIPFNLELDGDPLSPLTPITMEEIHEAQTPIAAKDPLVDTPDEPREVTMLKLTDSESPIHIPKRIKLAEDSLRTRKEEHDFEIESRRLDLQDKQQNQQFELESRKIDLEFKKEERLLLECQRKTEKANNQKMLYELMLKIMNK